MISPNMGIRVYGSEDRACLVVDHETETAVILPGYEYKTALALAERINGLLAESLNDDLEIGLRKKAREAAEEYKTAFRWLEAHSRELRETSGKKRKSPFEPEDVPALVSAIEKGYKYSRRLTKFEKAAIRRTLNELSPTERKVFILTKVWGLSVREVNRLLKRDVSKEYYRAKRKLENMRKKAKSPKRYANLRVIKN